MCPEVESNNSMYCNECYKPADDDDVYVALFTVIKTILTASHCSTERVILSSFTLPIMQSLA